MNKEKIFLIMAILFFGCGSKNKIMNESQFTELISSRLKKEYPEINFEIVGPLQIKSKSNDYDFNYYLDNIYLTYKQDPKKLEEIITDYLKTNKDLYNPMEKIVIQNIVPTIKPKDYLDEIKELSGEPEPYVVYEKYNDDLIIVYAEDSEASLKYFNKNDFKNLGINTDTLLDFSIKNLKRIIPEPQLITASDDVYGVLAGGVFEATIIIIDSFWTKDNFPVSGDIVVAIPNRDMLLVTGSKNKEGIEELKKTTSDLIQTGDHPISPYLFVRKNGKFERFE